MQGIGSPIGVQLPLTTKATDLVNNQGAGACIQIVNSLAQAIAVWDHSPEKISLDGSTPVDGNTGVTLAAYKTAVFGPASGTGWFGN